MTTWQLQTPVAFIIFNRPGNTERVFNEIAKAKPPKLLVIADGPRAGRAGEAEKCSATRDIIDRVDWDCEVLTNYSAVNLGCKNRVSSGIDWVFKQVEEAIILEDDCLPDPTFFRFCQEMLAYYRHDNRIGMISGDNFQFGRKRGDASYYFSRYGHIWGWASWRRAWAHYDRDAAAWPDIREGNYLKGLVSGGSEYKHWSHAFQSVYDGNIDTWDYQWTLSLWASGMLTVLPNVNLISNIGFQPDATHTRGESIYANLLTFPMEFPLRHPRVFLPKYEADHFTASRMFTSSLAVKLFNKVIASLRGSRSK
jgi:hypothetical protein